MTKEPDDLTSLRKEQGKKRGSILQEFIQNIKLVLRLMGDRRVNFFLKLLPIGALIYLVSPWDIAPGLTFPIIGALDDAAILWLGTSLFVNLCPDEVVAEHLRALQKVIPGTWHDTEEKEILDIEPRDVSEKPQP